MYNIYNCNKFKKMYDIINNYYLITILIILFIVYNGLF
jgi:hypothetical protein